MKGHLDASAKRVFEQAKKLIADGKVAEALAVYSSAFDAFVASGDHFSASNVAHMAGVAEPDPAAKLEWNERALREADAVEDRDSVTGFYASLYNNLAFSHSLLGNKSEALRCIRVARTHIDAIEPGVYRERAEATIGKRLDELEEALGSQEAD